MEISRHRAQNVVNHLVDNFGIERSRPGGRSSPLECQKQHPSSDHRDASPLAPDGALPEESEREDGDEHQAEFVYGCDFGGITNLECTEVAYPGGTCGKTGQAEKKERLAGHDKWVAPLPCEPDESPQHDDDDSGPDESGEVRVDTPDADFGKDRSKSSEHGGKKRPQKPVG